MVGSNVRLAILQEDTNRGRDDIYLVNEYFWF